MNLPNSQGSFYGVVIFLMMIAIPVGAALGWLTGRSPRRAAGVVAVVCLFALPFLFYFRSAVYGGVPAGGDTTLGWPFPYANAQSDAGLDSLNCLPLLFDFLLGGTLGFLSFRWLGRHFSSEATEP